MGERGEGRGWGRGVGERDAALTVEQRAVVRAAAFEINGDNVQRQFKVREEKTS